MLKYTFIMWTFTNYFLASCGSKLLKTFENVKNSPDIHSQCLFFRKLSFRYTHTPKNGYVKRYTYKYIFKSNGL